MNIAKKIFKIIGYIIVPLLFGFAGYLLAGDMNIYQEINKPFFAPPKIVFPIVWSILYVLMGISYYLVNNKKDNTANSRIFYYLQLLVNALWTLFFFRLKWFLFSFIWLVLLFILVILMIKEFKKTNVLSANLQIPYTIWLIIAGALNLGIYFLN